MFKRIRILAISLSLILLLSSCSSSTKSTMMDQAEGAAAPSQTTAAAAMTEDMSTADAADEDGGSTLILDPGNVVDSGKKIIYTVNMSLEAPDAAKAIDEIGKKAASLGGYVSDTSYNQYEESASASIVVRIPPEKLSDFTEHIGTLYKVLSTNMGSQDVTEQYVDAQSRLANAEAQEAQLLAIMAKAATIKDILAVRYELDTVQQEIEVLKGQIRLMDNQVGYSTVSIMIEQPAAAPESPEVDENEGLLARWSMSYIWQSVQKGFSNSLSFTVNALGVVLIALSYLAIPAVGIGIVVLAVILIVKHNKKKKPQNKIIK